MQDIEINRAELDFRAKEAFKTLRTNIEFSGEDMQVIGITSATPNEGKSSVSFELAVSFAQAGKKTLLIDADLRKSVMKNKYKRGKIRVKSHRFHHQNGHGYLSHIMENAAGHTHSYYAKKSGKFQYLHNKNT